MLEAIYSLILYTSDDPVKFKYFSSAFTERINQVSNVEFLEDHKIEEQFFTILIKDKFSAEFEKDILRRITLLKTKIKTRKFQQATDTSNAALKYYESQISEYPFEISQSTLTNFYFWNIIAQLNSKKAEELLNLFLTSTTLAQQNLLESQLSQELYEKFSILAQKQKQKPLIITSQPKKLSTDSDFDKSIAYMPPIDFFPIKLLDTTKIKSLVFIHWSSEKHYIQTVVMNSSNFADKRELVLQLKTKDDLQMAGDKISQFVFNYFKYLIE